MSTRSAYMSPLTASNALLLITDAACRPGLGDQVTTFFEDLAIMTVATSFGPMPVEDIQRAGTTVAWVVAPSQPVAGTPGAVRASADAWVFDTDGITCIGTTPGGGVSYNNERGIETITCEAVQPFDADAASEAAPASSAQAPSPAAGDSSGAARSSGPSGAVPAASAVDPQGRDGSAEPAAAGGSENGAGVQSAASSATYARSLTPTAIWCVAMLGAAIANM